MDTNANTKIKMANAFKHVLNSPGQKYFPNSFLFLKLKSGNQTLKITLKKSIFIHSVD